MWATGNVEAMALAAAGLVLIGCYARTVAEPPRPPEVEDPRTDVTGIPVAVSPGGLMKPGAERAIQHTLIERGLLPADHLTGRLDQPTQQALRVFQTRAGLPATGLPGYTTVEALGLDLDAIFERGPHPDASGPPG
jgi:hypothetical protein